MFPGRRAFAAAIAVGMRAGHDRRLELQADDTAFGWWRGWRSLAQPRVARFVERTVPCRADRTGGDPAAYVPWHSEAVDYAGRCIAVR